MPHFKDLQPLPHDHPPSPTPFLPRCIGTGNGARGAFPGALRSFRSAGFGIPSLAGATSPTR